MGMRLRKWNQFFFVFFCKSFAWFLSVHCELNHTLCSGSWLTVLTDVCEQTCLKTQKLGAGWSILAQYQKNSSLGKNCVPNRMNFEKFSKIPQCNLFILKVKEIFCHWGRKAAPPAWRLFHSILSSLVKYWEIGSVAKISTTQSDIISVQ